MRVKRVTRIGQKIDGPYSMITAFIAVAVRMDSRLVLHSIDEIFKGSKIFPLKNVIRDEISPLLN